jgi:hypothetical protein
MKDWRVRQINREVKKHDRDLFAKRSHTGLVQLFRKSKRWVTETFDDMTIHNLVDSPQYVLSLTADWSANAPAVEWGLEPIRQRLVAIDLWSNEELFEQIFENDEKVEASNKRNLKNNTEAFLYDFRSQFKKTFNDVNTSNMSKDVKRKMK